MPKISDRHQKLAVESPSHQLEITVFLTWSLQRDFLISRANGLLPYCLALSHIIIGLHICVVCLHVLLGNKS